jgi:hypothetical protein
MITEADIQRIFATEDLEADIPTQIPQWMHDLDADAFIAAMTVTYPELES